MAPTVSVQGIEGYKKAVADNAGKTVFALFTGLVDPVTGQSWCPDCSKADPVIEKSLSKLPEDAVFIHCIVGDRPTWKDPNNSFRTSELKLTSIPTLIKVGGSQRLQEDQCANEDLVEMLFTDN